MTHEASETAVSAQRIPRGATRRRRRAEQGRHGQGNMATVDLSTDVAQVEERRREGQAIAVGDLPQVSHRTRAVPDREVAILIDGREVARSVYDVQSTGSFGREVDQDRFAEMVAAALERLLPGIVMPCDDNRDPIHTGRAPEMWAECEVQRLTESEAAHVALQLSAFLHDRLELDHQHWQFVAMVPDQNLRILTRWPSFASDRHVGVRVRQRGFDGRTFSVDCLVRLVP